MGEVRGVGQGKSERALYDVEEGKRRGQLILLM
jgi:hypothetical protein